jgi:hypothetical protein
MAVRRQASFEVEGAPDDLLMPMVQALSDMRCYKFNRDGLIVTARTPINWRSVGEVMSVRLSDAGRGKTLVEVSSHSVLRTAIFDWGKNLHNLKRFEKAFMMRVGALGNVS